MNVESYEEVKEKLEKKNVIFAWSVIITVLFVGLLFIFGHLKLNKAIHICYIGFYRYSSN